MAPSRTTVSPDLAIRRYDAVMRYLAQESTMYWSRSQFFLVANAALFGFTANVTRGDLVALPPSQRLTLAILAVLGLALTVMWFRVLEAGRWWMDYFKNLCEALEQDAFGNFRVLRGSRDRPDHISARRVAWASAFLFSVFWLAALAWSILSAKPN